MATSDQIADVRTKLIEARPLLDSDLNVIHAALSCLHGIVTLDSGEICFHYNAKNESDGIILPMYSPHLQVLLIDRDLRIKLSDHLADTIDTFFCNIMGEQEL